MAERSVMNSYYGLLKRIRLLRNSCILSIRGLMVEAVTAIEMTESPVGYFRQFCSYCIRLTRIQKHHSQAPPPFLLLRCGNPPSICTCDARRSRKLCLLASVTAATDAAIDESSSAQRFWFAVAAKALSFRYLRTLRIASIFFDAV